VATVSFGAASLVQVASSFRRQKSVTSGFATNGNAVFGMMLALAPLIAQFVL